MKIKKIKISNFKGIGVLEQMFDNNLTQIRGATGSSKTSILDAIKWCLGYPLKNWEPKYLKTQQTIKDIVTKVELTLENGGIEYILTRTGEQQYKTSIETGAKLFTGYEYKYYFDSPADCKLKTYTEKIAELFKVDYDKLIYLLDTKLLLDDGTTKGQANWAIRRKWLYELLDIDNKTASLAEKENYNLIADELKKGKTEIDIQKMLNAEKKGISDKQTENRIIIEAKTAEMAEWANIDYESIKARKESINTEIEKLQLQNKEIQVNTLLIDKEQELEAIRAELAYENEKVASQNYDLHCKIMELEYKLANANKEIELCNQKIENINSEIEECEITKKGYKEEEFDSTQEICPTCQQVLPSAKIEQLKADFEKRKIEEIKNIEFKAENLAIEERDATVRLNTLTEGVKALETELNALKEIHIDDTECLKLKKQLEEKQNEVQNVPKLNIDNTINEKITMLKNEYDNCIRELVKQEQLEKIKNEIQNLKNSSVELAEQDSQRVLKQNQLKAYIEEKVAFVSQEINSHFEGITWQLFTENSDMAENKYEQTCFPVYNSGYYSSSTGEKIFICQKVNDGLQKLLNIDLWQFIDERQSTTLELESVHQRIELITDANQNFNCVKIESMYGEN